MTINKKRYIIDPVTLKGDQGEQGPPGPAAELNLPIEDTDVLHSGIYSNGLTLSQIIDNLLSIDLEIISFESLNPIIYEKGTSLSSLAFQWSLNKSVTSLILTPSLFGSTTPISTNLTSYTLPLTSANNNFSVTLTADDGSNIESSIINILFQLPIYYGKSVNPPSLSDALLDILSKDLSNTRQKSFQVDLGVDEYGFFAIPDTYVAGIEFLINGFNASMTNLGSFSHTNSSGHVQSYTVYRTENDNLGITNIEVL